MNETAFKFADFHTCVLEKIRVCATFFFFFSFEYLGIWVFFQFTSSVPEHEKGKGRRMGCWIEVDFFGFLRTRSREGLVCVQTLAKRTTGKADRI